MKWKLRFWAVLGNTLGYYDIAVFAAISKYLTVELEQLGYSQATEMIWGIFALRFFTRPIGGYVIGRYADRVGKKSALMLVSSLTGMTTLSMAFLPISQLGSFAPFAILFLQLLLAFSYAGESPSLSVYIYKNSAVNERSKISALCVSSGVMGVIFSLLIVFVLEKILTPELMQSIGWRIPLLLGLGNIIISFWFRFKLPEQQVELDKTEKINWYQSIRILLTVVPGSIIFYTLNFSSSLVGEKLNIGEFKSIYAISSSSLLLVFIFIVSYFSDKYSYAERVYKYGVISAVLFSIPLYALMGSGNVYIILAAQLIITLLSAMILCNWNYAMTKPSNGSVTTLGVGYNLASAIIGGITPITISYLVNINLIFVGCFVSLFCSLIFVVLFLAKNSEVPSKIQQMEIKEWM